MPTYDHIIAKATAAPWVIEPTHGDRVVDILNARFAGAGPTADDLRAAEEIRAARDRQKKRAAPPRVAMIAVHGVLTQRADWFTEMSGMASYDQIGQMVDAAAADPEVDAIVMDFDSPGGTVYGVEQCALKIAAAAKQKRVVAVCDSLMASGAYWLGTQASELVISPDGECGSVGVYVVHKDVSRAVDAAGAKVTYIKAGKYKTAGNPYEPLTPDGAAQLQAGVDDYYDLFVRAVARGRNATLTAVREGFGQGGMLRAKAAVDEGMADKIGSLDDVLARWNLTSADFRQASADDRGAIEVRRRRLRMG